MSAIQVEVTAEQIAAAAGLAHYRAWSAPLEKALEVLTGQITSIDGDGAKGYIATIGPDAWTLVIDLPEPACDFLDHRWENDQALSDGFAFDLEVPDWIVALVARAATTDEQAQAVLAADGVTS